MFLNYRKHAAFYIKVVCVYISSYAFRIAKSSLVYNSSTFV